MAQSSIVFAFHPSSPTQLAKQSPKLYNIYNDMYWAITCVLIALFAVALYYIKVHSKQKFAGRLMSLMLASNLSSFTCMLLFNMIHNFITNNPGETMPIYLWVFAAIAFIAFITSEAFFNIATWLLAFNYFMCSIKLDQVRNCKTQVTSSKKMCVLRCVFWTMLTMCGLSSVCWAWFRFLRNYSLYQGINETFARQEFYA
jgi:hypothetical protein